MKVVLFCGGLGLRLRDHSERVPKPMVPIGYRPILWHVMKYYAHFGHREFILCLGYKADVIKEYFLNYNEALSNDFVLRGNGDGGGDRSHVELLGSDIHDWRITFADTGLHANIGQRLRAVRRFVADEPVFLANYGDVLTDAPMNDIIDGFLPTNAAGSLLAVRPQDSFHVVAIGGDSLISGFQPVADKSFRINGGYFVLRQDIFDFMGPDQDLVMDACVNAAAQGRMRAVEYDGFWAPMDTLKERALLEEMYRHGECPWALWREDRNRRGRLITPVEGMVPVVPA
jgi:glucose-1-phosphate cytidylyltransferase